MSQTQRESQTQRGFRYTTNEIKKLLHIIKIILPLSDLEWQSVARFHNKDVGFDSHRTETSISSKYERLTNTEECDDTSVTKLAKAIKVLLIAKSGICTGDTDDSSLDTLSSSDTDEWLRDEMK